ncbi:MAG: hypothetical protein HY735_30575 [Verrucomicrobia bacterium]|nr:hypothetical protein [Verrucomicrobiota bacterium]
MAIREFPWEIRFSQRPLAGVLWEIFPNSDLADCADFFLKFDNRFASNWLERTQPAVASRVQKVAPRWLTKEQPMHIKNRKQE